MQFFRVGFRVSERRACQVAGVARSSSRYQSQAKDQTPLRQRLRELAAVRVRYGYRRLHVLLRREGWPVNHNWNRITLISSGTGQECSHACESHASWTPFGGRCPAA